MCLDKVMYYNFLVLLLLFICFSSINCLKNKDKPCIQYDTCKCIFPTGRGLNLTPIKQNLSAAIIGTNNSITIHLCEDVPFVNNMPYNECLNNVSICYTDTKLNKSFSFGKAKDMKFVSESQFQPIYVHFNNGVNLTKILLTCVEGIRDPILSFKLKSPDASVYDLELQSEHACVHQLSSEEGPGGLSLGSVLVIMLLVFTLVYFVGGMLTLKLLRGAEGKEMIPNIDFWMDLPYLVRDGILFTLNGFRPQTSYDRI